MRRVNRRTALGVVSRRAKAELPVYDLLQRCGPEPHIFVTVPQLAGYGLASADDRS
jgi:hypothetical protein